jgi:hypothetical protein
MPIPHEFFLWPAPHYGSFSNFRIGVSAKALHGEAIRESLSTFGRSQKNIHIFENAPLLAPELTCPHIDHRWTCFSLCKIGVDLAHIILGLAPVINIRTCIADQRSLRRRA